MIGVVCHDAGGAEVISSALRRAPQPFIACLDGPAVAVFERKLGALDRQPLAAVVAGCSELWCGTSWQSDLERDAIAAARSAGRRSVAWLDHWVNYRERFTRADGSLVLPDVLRVGDAHALAMARAAFGNETGPAIELQPNAYFADVVDAYRAARARQVPPAPGVLRLLFIGEPVSEHAERRFGNPRHWGYTEVEALEWLLAQLRLLARGGAKVTSVRVRPHPAERSDKYDAVLRHAPVPASTGGGSSLAEDLATVEIVAGCGSMALALAALCGLRAVSCIPPGGTPMSLPFAEIERLAA